jgi:Holliday junction resolvase
MTNSQWRAHEKALADAFRDHGWSVTLEPGAPGPDLLVSNGHRRYAIELKSSVEGRADRVIPLLSQAILQAMEYAARSPGARPLAVVRVERLTNALRERASRFHADYAPHLAVGLIDDEGRRWFEGEGLEALNAEPPSSVARRKGTPPKRSHDLFSDLNQWLLKVLLAPELPERLLAAPRGDYRTAAELAEAARVSAMSVSRFIKRLREEGFVDERAATLRLVRRAELFRRWRAAASRATPELPMRFLMPGLPSVQLAKLAARHAEACIGLFAAAGILQAGHVADGLPWVYVRKLPHLQDKAWPELVDISPGEPPQLILKQAATPESVFRGALRVDGAQVSDILQVWLDVSSHPARGSEQADHLARTVLAPVMGREG